jgi:hypothetical protein
MRWEITRLLFPILFTNHMHLKSQITARLNHFLIKSYEKACCDLEDLARLAHSFVSGETDCVGINLDSFLAW